MVALENQVSYGQKCLKNVLKLIFSQFLIVKKIKSEDKDLFLDSKSASTISKSAARGPLCLVKTLKTDTSEEKEEILKLKSGSENSFLRHLPHSSCPGE